MKKLLWQFVCVGALAAAIAAPGAAMAQDAGIAARMEAVQVGYETAVVAGDAEAFVALFAPEALYMPVFGGVYDGIDAIRAFAAGMPRPASLDIRTERWRWIGDVITDVGTFTLTLPPQAGGAVIAGEYTAIVVEIDGALRLLQLVTFPARGN